MNSRVMKKKLKIVISLAIILLLVLQVYVPVEANDSELYTSKSSSFSSEAERDFLDNINNTCNPNDYLDTTKIKKNVTKYDEIAATANSIVSGCNSDEEKVRAIHDWICTNVAYDNRNIQGGADVSPSYVYTFKRGVCQGYSWLANVMFKSIGIPVMNVVGDVKNSGYEHMWNLIYYGNSWHIFDFTWDSENKWYADSSEMNIIGRSPIYQYYDISPEEFANDHNSTSFDDYVMDFVSDADHELCVGQIYQKLVAEMNYWSGDFDDLVFESSDKTVATVGNWGIVNAVGVGTATITATSPDGTWHNSWIIKVTDRITKGDRQMTVGDTDYLNIIYPTLEEGYVWASSIPDVAIIENNSKVVAVGEGVATIYGIKQETDGASFIQYVVKVGDKSDTSYTVTVGTTEDLKVLIPALSNNEGITWKISNPLVATIDNNSIFTAVGVGETTITAITSDGNAVFQATVKVVESSDSEDPDPQPIDPDTKTENVISIDSVTGMASVRDDVSGKTREVLQECINEGYLYRMYDPTRGEHFYTKSEAEMKYLVASGWVHESNADFVVVDATEEDAIPVYRLYNPNDGGMHFYTVNAEEAKWLSAGGWTYEGISHYVFDKSSSKGTSQYRLYNPNSTNGEHIWTTDMKEYNYLKSIGWQDEGVCWKIK